MGENKEYKEMIDGFVEYQKNLHAKNQKKISVGLKVNILLPLVFLLLCFLCLRTAGIWLNSLCCS